MKVTVEIRRRNDYFLEMDPDYYIVRLSDGGVTAGPFMTSGEAFEWIRRWNRGNQHKKIYSLKI